MPREWTVHAQGSQGAQFGQGNTQINNFMLPPVEVTWPIRVGAVPPLADCYQERAEAGRLAEIMDGGGTAVLTQVLSGLGGVGKSQLAVGYARAAAARSDLLVWISAITRDAVLSAYAEAAGRLGYRLAREPGQAADWFLNWLATDSDRDWLIVLDDVTDPAHLRGLWPQGPRGRTLVTTRRTDAVLTERGRRLLPVGLYAPDEAVRYLGRKLGDQADHADLAEAAELAADLGHLPLALAQAAAFMLDRGESCAGYRRRLRDRRRTLADLFPEDALADDYQATIAATWSISVDLADRLAPVGRSRPLLELAGVLDPNGFPAELVATGAVTTWLDPEHPDPASARDALHNLARLSLLELDPGGGPNAVRVHALVQRAVRESLAEDRLPAVALAAADALEELWPESATTPQLLQTLGANARTVIPHAGTALWREGVHGVLFLVGHSYVYRGLNDTSRAHVAAVVRDAQRHLGTDHPDVLQARYVMAGLRSDEDAAAALVESRSVVSDCARVLGPDDTLTMQARALVVNCLEQAGDPAAAVVECEALLRDYRRVFGADAPDTMSVRAALARSRGKAGEHAVAVAELTELMADAARLFGPDHQITQEAAAELAEARTAGGLDATLAAYADLVRDRTTVLGADDPRTLAARLAGAKARYLAGDPAGAAADLEDLLPDAERVLGAEHDDVLQTRAVLAHCHGDAGHPETAVDLLENLLSGLVMALGPDESMVLAVRHSTSTYRRLAGDLDGAVADLTRLLADRRRLLGDDHPHTISTRVDLAETLREAGDLAAAAEQCRTLVADADKPAAKGLVDRLDTLNTLSELQVELDDVRGAVASYQELADRYTELLGPEDPTTIGYRFAGAACQATFDPAAGVALLEELLAEQIRLFGPDSAATLQYRRLVYEARLDADLPVPMELVDTLVADQRRVLGADHPDTLRTQAEQVLSLVPEEGAAPVAMEELFADMVRVLGPDDPHTLHVRYILLRLAAEDGGPEVLEQVRQLLADQRRVLGEDHPETLEVRWMIAFLQNDTGDLPAAIEGLRQLLVDAERGYDGEDIDLDYGRQVLAEWEARR